MGGFLFILAFVIIFFDLTQKFSVTRFYNIIFFDLVGPHVFFIFYLLATNSYVKNLGTINKTLLYGGIIVYFLYTLIRILVMPNIKKECKSIRVRIAYDGATILKISEYAIILQLILYLAAAYYMIKSSVSYKIFLVDFLICLAILIVLAINGATRVLLCCRRLGIIRRLIIYFNLWIPLVNIFLIRYMISKVKEEYMHTCDKEYLLNIRRESDICATKYPIIMLHGIGFRDVKYVNYWGRIPKELIKYGAKIYYGHQEAWGTVENNAREVREKIFEIMKENKCSKVNIIAHSKGGLDARFLITGLNMGQYVASLTTISTPHRGSEVMNLLVKLPNNIYKFITNLIDKSYKKLGDKNPNAYVSSRQLLPEYCVDFNKRIGNDNRVFYQSYTSVMKNIFSDSLLCIPYGIMKAMGAGENDGLVTIESAKWGDFRGTFRNKYRRGISHGDIIDLKREDYKLYDSVETFVHIVSNLKEKGF